VESLRRARARGGWTADRTSRLNEHRFLEMMKFWADLSGLDVEEIGEGATVGLDGWAEVAGCSGDGAASTGSWW
jgi:hypothetical protein